MISIRKTKETRKNPKKPEKTRKNPKKPKRNQIKKKKKRTTSSFFIVAKHIKTTQHNLTTCLCIVKLIKSSIYEVIQ